MTAVDESLTHLVRDQPLAVEDADGEAAQPHEDGADAVILGEGVQQRRDVDDAVLGVVPERERRPDDDRLARRLEAGAPVGVDGAPCRALQGSEPLDGVRAADVAAHPPPASCR